MGGFVALLGSASAGPWAQTGDASLRSDVELLVSVGVIDNIATQWPLPWAGLLDRISDADLFSGQPDYVRAVADRLRGRGKKETATGLHTVVYFDGTGSPATVRGYDALGRQSIEAAATVEYVWPSTVVHLNLGARSINKSDRQVLALDGSYIAQRLGDAVVYAGYMPHWWGPGWVSAMSLSTNARPMPQIGISRIGTAPFETPWLSWLGNWQAEFFVGLLDGPRVARNTIYDGLRVALSPLPGLEIALSRTDMMCGSGHPCKPLAGYFDVRNDPADTNTVNDQASIDVRYTNSVGGLSFAVYTQLMNEDTSPILHSGTSHLYGTSVWHAVAGGIGRITLEYTDSVPSMDIFSGSAMHGFAYNNSQYPDGMRYRGRSLGFSLDSDSRLMSMQVAFTDDGNRNYTVTYHHARVSDPLNDRPNVVTTASVKMNVLQGRVSLPLMLNTQSMHLDLELRVQDDQPRPNSGSLATGEVALRVDL